MYFNKILFRKFRAFFRIYWIWNWAAEIRHTFAYIEKYIDTQVVEEKLSSLSLSNTDV